MTALPSAAAKAAFPVRSGVGPTRRGKIPVKPAEAIEAHADVLGEVEMRDNGKLPAEMGGQTRYPAEWLRHSGGLADKVEGVGRKIRQSAAHAIKPVTLALGGRSPSIVFADTDLDAAGMGVVSGVFAATGRTCIAGSRPLVHKDIAADFVARLIEVAKNAKIGDQTEAGADVGPVTTAPQYEKALSCIAIAEAEGATRVFGGNPIKVEGGAVDQFVEPAIFTGVTPRMRIAREEAFGPVLAVLTFEDEEDAIANDFGPAAGVWTRDMGRALRMSERLQAGTVRINAYRAVSFTSPFGGCKRSGLGRESGRQAILEFPQTGSGWIATERSVANPFIPR